MDVRKAALREAEISRSESHTCKSNLRRTIHHLKRIACLAVHYQLMRPFNAEALAWTLILLHSIHLLCNIHSTTLTNPHLRDRLPCTPSLLRRPRPTTCHPVRG